MLAIDLFCGLGGWTEGLLAEGWDVIGFDLERHRYWMPESVDSDEAGGKGMNPVEKRGWSQGCAITLGMEGATSKPRTRLVEYPAQLVIQDVLTLHGSQFRTADLIVASPPCQAYSYRAMPWSRAKALPPPSNELFDACFRIQREACAAAGRHIPLIVENVRGAQKWVGRSRWNYGSFHLWGDVPALMPMTAKAVKVAGFRFDGSGKSFQSESVKVAGMSWSKFGQPGYKAVAFNDEAARQLALTTREAIRQLNPRPKPEGVKQQGSGAVWFDNGICKSGSKSNARKAASAMIAKIPLPLSTYIARVFAPA